MSLMNSRGGCCCCNNTAPNCNCLASSVTVDIPAWSYGSYSCPAQTVIAYKCCFTFGSQNYFVYRATPINIGTTVSNLSLCSTFFLNTYFAFFINYNNIPISNFCKISMKASIIQEGSFRSSGTCYTCVDTPLVIDATTACYGMSTNNLCSYPNMFMSTNEQPESWFTNATSCGNLQYPDCTNVGVISSTNFIGIANTNCSKINSFPVKFGTTEFTMTIS